MAVNVQDRARAELATLDGVISHVDATSEDSWQVNVVRSSDGSRNCFFGHLFAMAGDDRYGDALWNWFEEMWATTYMVYPVNDGTNLGYQQATPKQRILAYLHDLNTGVAKKTYQLMDEQFRSIGAAAS